MKYFKLIALLIFVTVTNAGASDWAAFSTIEKEADGKSFRETVFLVNDSSKTVTLKFPNFEFPGHGDTPAESIGPMGDVVLAPGEAIRFVHIIPLDRINGFATSIGIQDINEDIPIKRLTVKASFGHK
ncbi:MAG: hypothetical protein ABSD57_05335 [Verrucomicrobiota bacterium]|jgi:hypothetical protein